MHIADILKSKKLLSLEDPRVIAIYARQRGINSTGNDLLWLVAIDIMTLNVSAKMPGGNLNYENRLQLAENIKNGSVKVYACDISKFITDQKRQPAGGSPSEFILGVLTGTIEEIRIKLSPHPIGIYGDARWANGAVITDKDGYIVTKVDLHGVVFEALIYKYLVDYMLRNHITPNLPEYYGYLTCKGAQFLNRNRPNDWFTLLFMENMKGAILDDYLQKSRSVDVWRSILFQILYTLHCFHTLHFNHNDNHISNYFIQIFNSKGDELKDTVTYFTSSDTHYTVPIDGNLVKVFDFDLSSIDCNAAINDPKLPKDIKDQIQDLSNEIQNNCENIKIAPFFEKPGMEPDRTLESYGIVNENTPMFDVYILFCTLWNIKDHGTKKLTIRPLMPDPVKDFFHEAFGGGLLEYINPPNGFFCRVPELTKNPLFTDSGKPIYKTIPELFESTFFDEYRNSEVLSNNIFHLPGVVL